MAATAIRNDSDDNFSDDESVPLTQEIYGGRYNRFVSYFCTEKLWMRISDACSFCKQNILEIVLIILRYDFLASKLLFIYKRSHKMYSNMDNFFIITVRMNKVEQIHVLINNSWRKQINFY